jgi:sugar (pentulose or hexulose) kinase
VIQKPVYRTQTPEAAALGAAILAAAGCGLYPSVSEAARRMSAWDPRPVEPRPAEAAFYTEWCERGYRPLYPAVREPMRELARIRAARNRPPER